jgi:hypothetical protein
MSAPLVQGLLIEAIVLHESDDFISVPDMVGVPDSHL